MSFCTTKRIGEIIQFLNYYKWIFTSSNTKFISAGILEKLPEEWTTCLFSINNDEFNELPFDCINETWPSSLKDFLIQLQTLKYHIPTEIPEPSVKPFKGMSAKKSHEIIQLTAEIHKTCKNAIDIIIDMGSGLGYLSEALSEQHGYKVLAIEADTARVQTARNRQDKYFQKSIGSVKYVQHFIDSNSIDFLRRELESNFNAVTTTRLAIVGLHACADLTLTAIDLFFHMKNVKNIIIMPCCYHKMALDGNSAGGFVNIPRSKTLKGMACLQEILQRPFLRLASQQTAERWRRMSVEQHVEHGLDMFERAALENVLSGDEYVKKSRETKSRNIFDNYVLHKISTDERMQWDENHRERFNSVMVKYSNGPMMAEILTGLQGCIQQLCENVVMFDKVFFIQELANELQLHVDVDLKKIMDETLSPRCIVLTAIKK